MGRGVWLDFYTDRKPIGVALDAIVPDRPAAIFDSSGHAVLVNSKAMALAGIDSSTEPPEGGIIVKDDAGNPTGLLQEAAIELISPLMLSAFDDSALSENLLSQIEQFKAAGITRISEILAVPGVNTGALGFIHSSTKRASSTSVSIITSLPSAWPIWSRSMSSANTSSKVRFAGVKLWVDGSSGSWPILVLGCICD